MTEYLINLIYHYKEKKRKERYTFYESRKTYNDTWSIIFEPIISYSMLKFLGSTIFYKC